MTETVAMHFPVRTVMTATSISLGRWLLPQVRTSVALESAVSLVKMNSKSDALAHLEDMGAKLTLRVTFVGRTGLAVGARRAPVNCTVRSA